MNKPITASLTLAFALLSSACGLVQISTSGGGTTPAGGAGSDDAPAQSSSLGAAVAKAYAGWSYTSCASNEWCHIKIAGAAGVRPDGQAGGALQNPKPTTQNPDPEWIPGWDKLPEDDRKADEVWSALSLAASNKSWSVACKKAYAELKPGLDKRTGEVPEKVKAALAVPDKYERLRALLSLSSRAKGAPGEEGPFGEGFDAAAFETEKAVIEGFKREGKLFVFDKQGLGQSAATREVLGPRWAEGEEELAFCVRASQRGYKELPPLPPPHSPYTDHVVALVKPVFTEAELSSIATKTEQRKAEAAAALSTKDSAAPQNIQARSFDDRYTVKTFKADDKGGAIVKLHRRHDYNKAADRCVNGLGLRVPCPVTNIVVDEDVAIEFGDWPAGVKLEQGDSFSYLSTEKHTVDSKGAHEADTIEAKGLLLTSIKKKSGGETRYFK